MNTTPQILSQLGKWVWAKQLGIVLLLYKSGRLRKVFTKKLYFAAFEVLVLSLSHYLVNSFSTLYSVFEHFYVVLLHQHRILVCKFLHVSQLDLPSKAILHNFCFISWIFIESISELKKESKKIFNTTQPQLMNC